VIAGAGTGKTTTLSKRISYLVEKRHLDPKRILVTTFTRKATAELYNNAYEDLGEDVANQLKISTIDALIWDLAQQATHQGLMTSARLIGEANHRVLLLYCAWEAFGQSNAYSRSSWTKWADKAGLVGLLENCIRAEMAEGREKQSITQSSKSRLKELKNWFDLYSTFKIPTLKKLNWTVKKYFEKLDELGATDYDLLSRDFLRCLKRHKKLTKEFSSEFNVILVDEFQDTSRIQAEILILLSSKRRNIWVVGDPCQQIYEWRGAGPENLLRFIRETKAKRYYLTDNWRSTQVILDCAYHFLSRRAPNLKKNGTLKPLESKRNNLNNLPIFTGTLDRALLFVRQKLNSDLGLRPCDIAILSRQLDRNTVKVIKKKACDNRLKVQFHSSRADRAMESTIGEPPNWKAGKALKGLYTHRKIKALISRSLRKRDFSELRTLRPLSTAVEALDSTLPSQAFTFSDAWPALKKTYDREVSITPAAVSQTNAIQVMTIHAAKGLEFPVVLLMKLGKGGPRSFPNPNNQEDSRLSYVGVTRARDLLILVHTTSKPNKTLSAFGRNLVPIRRNRIETTDSKIEAPAFIPALPIVAATHLDLYEQCPLKFAAYHEGRFLPKWSVPQSMGSRMHKALEYYLRAEMPTDRQVIDQIFEQGLQYGDSPLRKLPHKSLDKMKQSYHEITKSISQTTTKIVAIEQRYRYLQGNSGQVEGIIDALLERRDGIVVLKEWKTSPEVSPERKRQYELQARVGALGIAAHNSYTIDMVEIVPVLSPKNTISIPYDQIFADQSKITLEQVFKDLRNRNYEPRRGKHCKLCPLKPQCPHMA